jgi:Spy/CpxP family protein refolding chaperone
MRKTSPFILSLVLGSALVASPPAWADGGPYASSESTMHKVKGHHGSGSHLLRHLLRAKQELGLSEDQIAKLRTVALDADRARIRAEADQLISKRELLSIMWDEKVEPSMIESKIKEERALDAAVRIIAFKAKRDLLSVLTEEQRSKLRTLWSQHRHHPMRADRRDSRNADVDVTFSELDESEDGVTAG